MSVEIDSVEFTILCDAIIKSLRQNQIVMKLANKHFEQYYEIPNVDKDIFRLQQMVNKALTTTVYVVDDDDWSFFYNLFKRF